VTLPTERQILITRTFEAPRALVYRAWTTPDLIRQWWAGDRGTVTHVEVDLRAGGAWRYVMRTRRGVEVAFHGQYLEVTANERLVSTDVFEGAPGEPAQTTVTFTGDDAGTTLTILTEYASRESRDAVIRSGMEGGMQASLDHLERALTSRP